MTLYGWDQSHYDGALTVADMQRARAEGISFVTHKLGEGLGNIDPTAVAALNAARAAGIPVLGVYWFCHQADDPAAEAQKCVDMLDQLLPWWRDHPAFFIQADCETEGSNGKPSRVWIREFAAQDFAGHKVVTYASHGMYGDGAVTDLMWNAAYGSNHPGDFKSLYPGDHSAGWGPFPGYGTPIFLQYSSAATIAGHTTCDANAHPGTLDDLLTLIGADMPFTAADVLEFVATETSGITNPAFRSDSTLHTPPGSKSTLSVGDALEIAMAEANVAHTNTTSIGGKVDAVAATLAGVVKSEAAIQATLATMGAGGGSVDTATLAAQIKAVGDQESADMTNVLAALAAAQQRNADLEARLAAALTAQ